MKINHVSLNYVETYMHAAHNLLQELPFIDPLMYQHALQWISKLSMNPAYLSFI